jgi:hypothetical protein
MLTKLNRLLVLATIGALVLLLSPPAVAAPGDAIANAPTLSLRDLGSDPDIALYGSDGVQTINIPVLPGTVPTMLNATVLVPVFVRTATLTVLQDDRVIARVDVPTGPTPGPVPLSIPLAGVRVVDNAVSLMLRANILPIEDYCLDSSNPLRLNGVTVGYAGAESVPTAVADFLPPVLRRLTIYLGAKPSRGEADAAVQLAASAAAYYGRQYPAISVARLDDPANPPLGSTQPFERQIVIAQGPDTGISLRPGGNGVPTLMITGSQEALDNQARLLTSGLAKYALASAAVAGPLAQSPQLTGNLTTIRKLGQPGVNSTSLSPEVYVNIDQTRLGRPSHNVRVHLRGSYTPLPQSLGGRLVASIGGETIDRWSATNEGVIDRWVDIPDRLLQRLVSLRVQFDVAGNTGRCGEFQPLTLTIDGESEVSSAPADPPVPAGFQSLPQALMPRVAIGIKDNSFADVARAGLLVVGMQRLSGLPFDTAVMPLQDAIAAPGSAVLIDPDGWDHPEVKLPVVAPNNIPMTMDVADGDGKPTTLTLEPSLKFGSLQTVYDGKRSLLVATSNGAPGQLDELLRWLSADRHRVAGLDGLALISVPGREPVVVTESRAGAAIPDTGVTPTIRPFWFAAGVLALLVGVAAGALLLRRRRRGSPEG